MPSALTLGFVTNAQTPAENEPNGSTPLGADQPSPAPTGRGGRVSRGTKADEAAKPARKTAKKAATPAKKATTKAAAAKAATPKAPQTPAAGAAPVTPEPADTASAAGPPAPGTPTAPEESAATSEGAGLRVVVAEDEALIRLDLAEMLEDAGYQVVGQAPDGQQAVEPDTGQQPPREQEPEDTDDEAGGPPHQVRAGEPGLRGPAHGRPPDIARQLGRASQRGDRRGITRAA